MATYNALFSRLDDLDPGAVADRVSQAVEQLEARDSLALRVRSGNPWCQLQSLGAECGPGLAGELSKVLATETILLMVQTVVNAFGYWHFQRGKELRCLVRGFEEEMVWEEVRGIPEKWEAPILFRKGAEMLEDFLEDEGPKRAAEVRRIYEERRIVAGEEHPLFDTSFGVYALGQHLGLPGFEREIDPQPKYWTLEREISESPDQGSTSHEQ